jgi:betaine-aldehyde dehydrogenase
MSTTSTDVRTYGHHIGGQRVAGGGGQIERRSPATGQLVARWADGTAEDVAAAVTSARAAFDSGAWSDLPGAERARVLLRLAALVGERREELARIDADEVGKPLRLARGDVDATVVHLEYAAALAHELRGDTYTNLGPAYVGLVQREPVGVAGLITPWNFPVLSYGEKVAYALAAGCTVVLKPSELTSSTALEVTALAEEAGVPAGVVNVVTGSGATVGQALVESPGVDYVSFTGSTATGERIATAAAKTLKRVSLELGGKGANIVLADADLDDAVDGALFASFFNTGECCVAGSRLLVQDTIADAFVARLAERAERIRVGGPDDDAAEIGALISEDHAAKVLDLIASGTRDGASLVSGGKRLDGEHADGVFVEPTVFDRVRPDARIFREEIFGPVMVVTRFGTVDEAIALANDTTYGLGNSVWTKDVDTALRMTRELRSGTVWVNTTIDSAPQMPFGGMKASGYGREGGRAGVEEYTQLKSCVIRSGKRDPFFA